MPAIMLKGLAKVGMLDGLAGLYAKDKHYLISHHRYNIKRKSMYSCLFFSISLSAETIIIIIILKGLVPEPDILLLERARA